MNGSVSSLPQEPGRAGPAAGAEPRALRTLLDEAAAILETVGPEFGHAREHLVALRERLDEGRFHLAVLGQFKRGKSTLLNALLGEPVLPTSVVPLTAIPTFVRAGDTVEVRVQFEDDRPAEVAHPDGAAGLAGFLARFVTEEGNPKNRRGVSFVEVSHPAPILREGVVLIDTPGIGSTFRHNTEATLNFLSQCDAALFLVSADPPITEVEVAFLKEVRSKVARLFFILNKVDYLGDGDREAALAFFRGVLADQVGIAGARVFCVSAKAALSARSRGDDANWEQSGLAAVEEHLVEFLAREKAQTLCDALSRKTAAVLGQALMRLQLGVKSLRLPVEELEQRLATFEQTLDEIELERVSAGDLLDGNRKRMLEFLEEYSEDLRRKSRNYLDGVVKETAARREGQELREEDLQEALAAAIPGFFEHELGRTTRLFEEKTTASLRPHQERADRLIKSVRRAAAELFDVPYRAPESSEAFEVVRRPYWVTHKWAATLRPVSEGLVDRFMPAGVRRARILRRIGEQIATLVTRNVENLRWATFRSVNETFLRFRRGLDDRLADTIAATHGAIQAALEKRKKESETAARDVVRLEAAAERLERLAEAME